MRKCTACSYLNINPRSTKCHVCSMALSSTDSIDLTFSTGHTVIDLTDICSESICASNNRENTDSLNDCSQPRVAPEVIKSSRSICREFGVFNKDSLANTNDDSFKKESRGRSNKIIEFTSTSTEKELKRKRNPDGIHSNMYDKISVVDQLPHAKKNSNLINKPKNCVQSEKKHQKKQMSSCLVSSSETTRGLHSKQLVPVLTHNHGITSYLSKQNWKRTTSNTDSQSEKTSLLTDDYNAESIALPIEALMDLAVSILKMKFNHDSLRPLQKVAVKRALQRTSQIIIMSTGGGKSLCYQLPALVCNGNMVNVYPKDSIVSIVICPLIALMVDQVHNLHMNGVLTAAYWSSSLSAKLKSDIYKRLRLDTQEFLKGKASDEFTVDEHWIPIQLLYCTPELIETEKFRSILTKLYASKRLYQFVIDEAHCLSTWGHDFRPAYKKLNWLREAYPDIPLMACTGTATSKVIEDIREILSLNKKTVPCLMGTFNRENISYEVRYKEYLNMSSPQGAVTDLLNEIQKQHDIANKGKESCSGIIYVHKRDDCISLATHITRVAGLVAVAYHAGLKDTEREDAQLRWTNGNVHLVVATVAFGMGIDLAHVRYVIHWTMPKSLEGFYQESGRGGRDGKPTTSIVYYSKDEASMLEFLVKKNAETTQWKKKPNGISSRQACHSLIEFKRMVDYCIKLGCRRKYVLHHFGENIDANAVCKRTCDFCKDPLKVERSTEASECMSAIVGSRYLRHRFKNNEQQKKPSHRNSHYSEETSDDHDEPDKIEELLDIAVVEDNAFSPVRCQKQGFVKASCVLNKYQEMESSEIQSSGTFNLKSRIFDESENDRSVKKYRPVVIPAHLRKNVPDPHAGLYKGPPADGQKASDTCTSEAERLKAEIESLQLQKVAALAKLNETRVSSLSSTESLPAPFISFKKRY